MKNTSAVTWTNAARYALLSQGPQGNTTWGLSSVNLPASIAPNTDAVFSFTITAPAAAGTYRFEWRMAQNSAGFGDFSPALSMVVQ